MKNTHFTVRLEPTKHRIPGWRNLVAHQFKQGAMKHRKDRRPADRLRRQMQEEQGAAKW